MAVVVEGKRKFPYDEYVLLPDDGKRPEIIDRDHCLSPAPAVYHQRLSARLNECLRSLVDMPGKDEVLFALVDVELTETDIVQPDLIMALAAHASIIAESRIVGAPDLVVEIISPSNRRHDTELKLELYRRSNVGGYWIVDPDAQAVTVYASSDAGLTKGHAEI